MDVNGLDSGSSNTPVRPTESLPNEFLPANEAASAVPGLEGLQEKAEVAETTRIVEQPNDDPDLRAARLARIQAEVAAGTYETAEKLKMAVERLLRDIG